MKCCDYGTKSGNILILKNIPLTANLSQTIPSFSFTETSFDVIKDYFIIVKYCKRLKVKQRL